MKSKCLEYLENLITEDTPKKELDIIEYIKKCVKDFKEKEKVDNSKELYIEQLFNKFYSIYLRKGGREQAKKTFKKKLIKLKTNEDILEKARKIARLYSAQTKEWEINNTDRQFIPMCSSWLNANIPD